MSKILCVAVATAVAASIPHPALAQGGVTHYELSPTEQTRKVLPKGYFYWTPVPSKLRDTEISVEGMPLCASLEAAIALGDRLWRGLSPEAAVQDVARKRSDEQRPTCGFTRGRRIRPVEHCVRGDSAGRPVWVIRWIDDKGTEHLSASP